MSASAGNLEFARAMVPVAIEIMGEPNKSLSNKDEMRWGARGSLSVDVRAGTWCDFESGAEGGGCLDFVMQKKRLEKADALSWMRERGLLPSNGDGSSRRIVKTYDYHDANGTLVFQVVRYEPKNFRQRRPDPASQGGWTWKTAGMLLPLYRLPELLDAIGAGKTVYVAEGEKSVDALAMLGLVATCSPGGAGKWHAHHSAELRTADVVLLPDNDPAGRDHVAKASASIKQHAKRIRTLALPGLPDKGDPYDWIAAGGTASALQSLADAVKADNTKTDNHSTGGKPALYVLTPAECVTAPMREYVVKGLLSRRDHGGLIGLPGSGKSVLAPYIGYRVSLGLDVFGRRTTQMPVLYLAAEDGTGMILRVRALHDRMGNSPGFFLEPLPIDLMASESPDLSQVHGLIDKYKPGLVILDTIARAFPGLRENDPDGMGEAVRVIRTMSEPCGSAVLSLHHPPKDSMTPRGHGVLNGDMDMTLYLEGERGAPRHVTMGKNRSGPSDLSFDFSLGVQVFPDLDQDGDPITAPIAEPTEISTSTRATAKEARLRDRPAVLLRELRTLLDTAGTMVCPDADHPIVRAVTRLALRRRLIERGWFSDDLLCVALGKAAELTRPGYATENNALTPLKRNGFVAFNREWIWAL